jgi:hypothetical protein
MCCSSSCRFRPSGEYKEIPLTQCSASADRNGSIVVLAVVVDDDDDDDDEYLLGGSFF